MGDDIYSNKNLKTYVKVLKRRLWWLRKGRRDEILNEVIDHITTSALDIMNSRSIAVAEAVEQAISGFGTPEEVALSYRGVYPPATHALTIFALISVVISVFTLSVPILNTVAPILYALLLIFVFYSTLRFGTMVGWTTAISAMLGRIFALGTVYTILYSDYVLETSGIILFAITTVMMALPVLAARPFHESLD